jgi:hypothetical protein
MLPICNSSWDKTYTMLHTLVQNLGWLNNVHLWALLIRCLGDLALPLPGLKPECFLI